MPNKISPELAAGLKDYLPAAMIPRQQMLDTIRRVFEIFGFLPLDTPGLEKEEVLTGGDQAFKMQIFRAGLCGGDEDLALRFDLTVPLARVISLYPDQIEKPFKRYQVGKVWRGEKPQAGRFREFVQFDADIVGSNRIAADAEIVSLMYETLTSLGLQKFVIKVNNRKILNGLSQYIGFKDDLLADVLRIIDKLDKISWVGVADELREKAGFSDDQLSKLQSFLEVRSTDHTKTLDLLEKMLEDSSIAMEGLSEFRELVSDLDSLAVPRQSWQIDLSVACGLGYYTGLVFETILLDLPSIGSVFSGGRYDDLVSRFSQQNVPATGASVGVDRLYAAMSQMSLLKQAKSISQVFVANFDPLAASLVQEIVTLLRRAGVPSELYLGKEVALKGQLAHAVKREIPVVILVGGDELNTKTVTIKDMNRRKQKKVTIADLVSAVKDILTSG